MRSATSLAIRHDLSGEGYDGTGDQAVSDGTETYGRGPGGALDLRRDDLQPRSRGQLPAAQALPARFRLQHRQDPLVVRRQDRRRHALGPPRHGRARHRAPRRLRDLGRRLGQYLGHCHAGIHQPLQRTFRVTERGLHPLGPLPQPRDLFPDPLLPGLQQAEHRRHQPPPRARRADQPRPSLPPPTGVHAHPPRTNRSRSESGWRLSEGAGEALRSGLTLRQESQQLVSVSPDRPCECCPNTRLVVG